MGSPRSWSDVWTIQIAGSRLQKMVEKKCWSCEARTPYNQAGFLDTGWCPDCRSKIPEDIYASLVVAKTEPFAGQMRMVVADLVKVNRVRANAKLFLVPKAKPGKPKLNLDDLDI